MSKPEFSKTGLLKEIKIGEWRKDIDDEEYESNKILIDEIHKKHLETVSLTNKRLPKRRLVSRIEPKVFWRIDENARKVYQKWKEEKMKVDTVEEEYPEIPIQNLLYLIRYLSVDPSKEENAELKDCLNQQNSEFETFWDSPSYIMKALRKCVLTRDWTNMTYFLLILLNFDKKYIAIVKNMCQIMVKYNPLVRECNLEDQFNKLLRTKNEELTIV